MWYLVFFSGYLQTAPHNWCWWFTAWKKWGQKEVELQLRSKLWPALYHRVSAMQAIDPSHDPYSPFTILTGHWYAGLYDHWGPQGWYWLLWWSRLSRWVACCMKLWAWDGVSSSIGCVYTAQCDETQASICTHAHADTHTCSCTLSECGSSLLVNRNTLLLANRTGLQQDAHTDTHTQAYTHTDVHTDTQTHTPQADSTYKFSVHNHLVHAFIHETINTSLHHRKF